MTENELRDSIAFGREQRQIEFKSPGPRTDAQLVAKVIRAMLGMANKAHGGYVIVGVHDDGTNLDPIGVNAADLATWNYDDLASKVGEYADPFISFNIAAVPLDGKNYVVIEMQQFESVPIICERQYDGILKDGALYVRGTDKIETIEVNSYVLMRELIDRATDTNLKGELERFARLGLLQFVQVPPRPTDDEQFEQQSRGLS